MFGWNLRNRQDHLRIVSIGTEQISGREINRVSQNVRSNLLQKRTVRTEIIRSGKRWISEICFEKRAGWGWGFDLCGLAKVWWVMICVMNRSLPYSMSDDYFANRSLSRFGEWRRRVVSLSKESLKSCFTNFFKTFRLWVFWGGISGFWCLRSFPCFLVKSRPLWMFFFEAPFCVHFCLMNLVMICQTA